MASGRDLTRPMVRTRTGLKTHQARRLLLEKCQNLTTAQLTANDCLTKLINPVHLKDGLRKIQTNRGNFAHRTAPFLAVLKATALWHLDAGGGSRPLHQEPSLE